MVVVVVRPPRVPTEVVEFAEEKRVVTAVVERVEDRHAVDGQGDRATVELGLRGDGMLREHGPRGDPPRVASAVGLGRGHLLLPRRDDCPGCGRATGERYGGAWPSGKARDFGPRIRRFESFRPSQTSTVTSAQVILNGSDRIW